MCVTRITDEKRTLRAARTLHNKNIENLKPLFNTITQSHDFVTSTLLIGFEGKEESSSHTSPLMERIIKLNHNSS